MVIKTLTAKTETHVVSFNQTLITKLNFFYLLIISKILGCLLITLSIYFIFALDIATNVTIKYEAMSIILEIINVVN
jgi:hypothetical protein